MAAAERRPHFARRVPRGCAGDQWGNVTQAQFAQDLAMFQQWEQNQTGDPPPDMVKATVACTG